MEDKIEAKFPFHQANRKSSSSTTHQVMGWSDAISNSKLLKPVKGKYALTCNEYNAPPPHPKPMN
jgi:hypothetical protein